MRPQEVVQDAAREVIESLADDRRSSLQPLLLLSGLVVLSGLLAGVQLWMLDRVAERIALGARLGLAGRRLRLRLNELDRRNPLMSSWGPVRWLL